MEIRKASVQGFCFGVAITVKKAEEAIASRGEVTTLGHVVHNPQMVESLQSRGLRNAQSVDEVDAGALFVRAHGLPVDVFQKAKSKGLEIIDATCPMVTKIHVQAEKLKTDGYKIVVIGDPAHPEVKGTLSHVPGAWCIQSVDDVAKLPRSSKVGVVVQSTWSGQGFTKIVQALAAKYYEVRAVNTICTDTHNRQDEALRLARDVRSDGRRRRKDVGEHQAFGRTLRIARRARLSHRECGRTSPGMVRRRQSRRLDVRRVDARLARRRSRVAHGGA